MAPKRKKPKENYLKVPNHILNIEGLGKGEKMLFAHIYSFGAQGCWQSNKILGKMFYCSTRTISLWVANLKKGKYVSIKSGKGYFRTMYANSHPEVKEAQTLWYRGRKIPKPSRQNEQAKPFRLRKNLPSKCAKSCEVSAKKSVFLVRKEPLTTNNTTTKETNGNNAKMLSPLSVGGQDPALLQDRKTEQQAKIVQFKKNFGRYDKPGAMGTTLASQEQRKQAQIRDLLGNENI